jgi:hypothetical protein
MNAAPISDALSLPGHRRVKYTPDVRQDRRMSARAGEKSTTLSSLLKPRPPFGSYFPPFAPDKLSLSSYVDTCWRVHGASTTYCHDSTVRQVLSFFWRLDEQRFPLATASLPRILALQRRVKGFRSKNIQTALDTQVVHTTPVKIEAKGGRKREQKVSIETAQIWDGFHKLTQMIGPYIRSLCSHRWKKTGPGKNDRLNVDMF